MGDPIRRIARDEEYIRRLRLRQNSGTGGSETKTFIVDGALTTDMRFAFYVSVNPDGKTPESKFLWGFWAKLRLGTATFSWLHNDVFVIDHLVTDTTTQVVLPEPIALADGDTVGINVWDVSTGPNAMVLEAAAIMVG